jgi:hypothetical protein
MFDATNTTRERRRWLIERSKETGAKVRAYVSELERYHALRLARYTAPRRGVPSPRPAPQSKLTQSGSLAKVIFIESILTDEDVITKNIVASKVGVKDYCGIDAEQALRCTCTCTCVCTYVSTCTCNMHMHMHMQHAHISTCTCTCNMHTYAYAYAMHMHMHMLCICICIHIHICIHMYICTCMRMHMHMHTYVHAYAHATRTCTCARTCT